jgi:hypothetical protein
MLVAARIIICIGVLVHTRWRVHLLADAGPIWDGRNRA